MVGGHNGCLLGDIQFILTLSAVDAPGYWFFPAHFVPVIYNELKKESAEVTFYYIINIFMLTLRFFMMVSRLSFEFVH